MVSLPMYQRYSTRERAELLQGQEYGSIMGSEGLRVTTGLISKILMVA